MYDTSVTCTYQVLQDQDESNNMYQSEFLQAFGLSEYDQGAIDRDTDALYSKMKDIPGMLEILQEIENSKMSVFSNMFSGTDKEAMKEFSFVCLFSYDLFHVFHPYIRTCYSTDAFPSEAVNVLRKAILSI